MFMVSFSKPKNIDFSRFVTKPNCCSSYMVDTLFAQHFSNDRLTNYHLNELTIHNQVHVAN